MISHPDRSLDLNELDLSNIREVYKEFANKARAYMDLRFKHFATFSVLTTFLGTAAYQNRSLEHVLPAIMALGLTVCILFWVLDHRTAQYLRYYSRQTQVFEDKFIPHLRLREELMPKMPTPRIVGASAITNVIFAVILVAWTLLLLFVSLGPTRLTNVNITPVNTYVFPNEIEE
jgi:hypothetical protein